MRQPIAAQLGLLAVRSGVGRLSLSRLTGTDRDGRKIAARKMGASGSGATRKLLTRKWGAQLQPG
ncbi:hypothetical protein TBK1r_49170 [Stieleria magnilauensis]|uniref:Uncharacterized protein n=1 Tax=Stieleria magnilauensis TaxID=2527963 RepID=A0ABX5XY88_9BACT|nr:hypothetical protein TBK1r_49170 [Planctomycetes bacterium TBK1r]